MQFREERSELQVVDRHAPLGVGVRYESGLRLCGKWVAPEKSLAFRVFSYAPRTCSGGVRCAFPGWGGGGSKSRRCVGLSASSCTSWRHVLSSSWTAVESGTRLLCACRSACYRRLNIPCAPATARVMLRSSPKMCHHLKRETWYAAAGISYKVARTLLS